MTKKTLDAKVPSRYLRYVCATVVGTTWVTTSLGFRYAGIFTRLGAEKDVTKETNMIRHRDADDLPTERKKKERRKVVMTL